MRRPSNQGDTLSDMRQSPSMHAMEESGSSGRRKSLLPPVGGLGHRPSLKPGSLMAIMAKKSKLGKANTEEREKSAYPPHVNLEPTYRMEPGKKFYPPQVHVLLKQILEAHLDGFTFNQKFTNTMTKVLSDEIKDRVKGLGFDRYKLVVSVVLGERREQGVMISSRAAWDAKLDSYATYTFQNNSLFCTASVYGVYAE